MLKDLLSMIFKKEDKKGNTDWGFYLLSCMVVLCLILAIGMLTGCGKEKTKEVRNNLEMFEVKTKVRFLPDGLGYQAVDVTFYITDDILNDEKQLAYCHELFTDSYELKEEEWQVLCKNKEITISTHRD